MKCIECQADRAPAAFDADDKTGCRETVCRLCKMDTVATDSKDTLDYTTIVATSKKGNKRYGFRFRPETITKLDIVAKVKKTTRTGAIEWLIHNCQSHD